MPSGRRSNADEPLAASVATGQKIADAAAAAGVSVRTAHRRLATPAFRQRVQSLRGEMLAAAAGKLCGAAGKAVDVLQALLDDPTARVRLRAALGILSSLLRVREQTDLEERLGRLEAEAEARTHAGANGRLPWPQ